MATITHQLPPGAAQFASSAFPQLIRSAGTLPGMLLGFDATTSESAYWMFRALSYGSGNLTLDISWYADTASSGAVVWQAAIAAITPDTDTQDVETKSFATAQQVTDTHLGTTGQRLHRATLTITNLDSIAANDLVWLRISRLPADAADTMTGDALLVFAALSYSDT